MPNTNSVVFAGNLVRDPELKELGDDHCVANFTIANNTKIKDQEITTYIDCAAWNKTGELVAKYFSKGSPIIVEGNLRQDKWQDKDGNARSKIKINVQRWSFAGGKGEGGQHEPAGAGYSSGNDAPPSNDSEDIPF